MPETPKSFEGQVKVAGASWDFGLVRRLAFHEAARVAAESAKKTCWSEALHDEILGLLPIEERSGYGITLPPPENFTQPAQAAAVPARQDAVPEPTWPCGACGNPMKRSGAGMHVSWRDDRACDNRCGWSTQPPQTAVGEGELPADGFARIEEAYLNETITVLKRLLRKEREDHLKAIAQRDEALSSLATEQAIRRDEVSKLAAQRDEARSVAKTLAKAIQKFRQSPLLGKAGKLRASAEFGDLVDAWVNHEHLTDTFMEYRDRAEAAEAKLAALEVPKPESEEIERLACYSFNAWNVTGPEHTTWEFLEESDKRRWREMLTVLISRIHSLPSEPAGKAGENGGSQG